MFAKGVIILLCVLVAISDGARKPNCIQTIICPRAYHPICGTDGLTYINECKLCAANKALKSEILIQKEGRC